MADEAIASIQVSVLPDEIRKTLSSTMTVTPADANDKFYYKLTSVSNSSTDLIAGSFLDYTAVDDDTAPTAVATGDKVKFLFIKKSFKEQAMKMKIEYHLNLHQILNT